MSFRIIQRIIQNTIYNIFNILFLNPFHFRRAIKETIVRKKKDDIFQCTHVDRSAFTISLSDGVFFCTSYWSLPGGVDHHPGPPPPDWMADGLGIDSTPIASTRSDTQILILPPLLMSFHLHSG